MKNGFSFIELMIALIVMLILVLLAAPAYQNFIGQNRITAAAESLYSDMALARSEALRKKSTVFVAVQTGTSWCYGLSDAATCNCTTSNSCKLNGIERVVSVTAFPGVTIGVSGLTGNAMSFEGIHGSSGATGQVNFTASSKTLSAAVTPMGNIRICSSNVGGYSGC